MQERDCSTACDVRLRVERRGKSPVLETVTGVPVGAARTYRLTVSPGFAQGVARGDVVKVEDDGRFEVIRRSGLLCIRIFGAPGVIQELRASLPPALSQLGGRIDGGLRDRMLICDVPVDAGFRAVEKLMSEWVEARSGTEWYYGNVYDPIDGETPLKWWE